MNSSDDGESQSSLYLLSAGQLDHHQCVLFMEWWTSDLLLVASAEQLIRYLEPNMLCWDVCALQWGFKESEFSKTMTNKKNSLLTRRDSSHAELQWISASVDQDVLQSAPLPYIGMSAWQHYFVATPNLEHSFSHLSSRSPSACLLWLYL